MMSMSKLSTILALATFQTKLEDAVKSDFLEASPRAIRSESEVPKFLRQSPDGRSIKQIEKRAQKQALKDRRRAFRHSVDKNNRIAKSVDIRKKSQQARMSEIDYD